RGRGAARNLGCGRSPVKHTAGMSAPESAEDCRPEAMMLAFAAPASCSPSGLAIERGPQMRDRLADSIKEAMRARDTLRLSTLRLMSAALKDHDIARRSRGDEGELPDAEIWALFS